MKIKYTLPVLVLAVLSFVMLSFSTAGTSGDTITIKKGIFSINGSQINKDWSWSTCKAALGTPDRTYEGYNTVYTYDSKAINIFEPLKDEKPSGTVSEVQVYFQVPEKGSLTPKTETFPGKMKVDKLEITKNLSAKTMLSKLKKWEKTDSFIEHSYRMQYQELYIYFHFNTDETSLLKVSVGPVKKTTTK